MSGGALRVAGHVDRLQWRRRPGAPFPGQFLSGGYGRRSFVVDGQCRFWRTTAPDGWVYTGTLDTAAAQEFADAIGYGQLSEYSSFDDPPCPDGAISTLEAPEGKIRCSCQCTTNPDAPEGWLEAFRVLAMEDVGAELFAGGEAATGAARLLLRALVTSDAAAPQTWPLERDPTPNEIVYDVGFVTSTSGGLIEDRVELELLRAMRAEFAPKQSPFTGGPLSVPIVWTDPATQLERPFDLLLRDEVPEKVRAALVSAAQ